MNVERLQELGFNVVGGDDSAEITAELLLPLVNPLTRRFIDAVAFAALPDGRLVTVFPPELIGLAPLSLTGVERLADFEAQLHLAWDDAVLQLQRRSAELQALGVEPQVEPNTLTLTATVATPSLRLRIGADKLGQFRVVEARRGEDAVPLPADPRFELSEFREGQALAAYLEAMLTEGAGPQTRAPAAAPAPAIRALTLGELLAAFGDDAMVPQKTAVEVVIDLRVEGQKYRFAASRVAGETFRGLLAGPRGKVWADRFELSEFPGVTALVASELGVPQEKVERSGS